MPWPPRLLSPPLLPLLTILMSFTWAPSASAALSYGDGQPEYPSQPELTSDRDALARIFLQDLLEKEGNSRTPNGYANREDDTWLSGGRSLRRSDGGNLRHHFIPLQDVYPREFNGREYGNVGSDEEALDEEGDGMDPRTERERIISELLARGHPYTGHRVHGYVDPSHLADDPEEQNLRLKELLRLVMGEEENPSSVFRGHEERPGTPAQAKDLDNGSWGRPVVIKRNPFGINARGFHDDVFNRDFGSFNPMKRVARSVEQDVIKTEGRKINQTNDSSVEGTKKGNASRRVKRSTKDDGKADSSAAMPANPKPSRNPKGEVPNKIPLKREERSAEEMKAIDGQQSKRRPEMDSSGFHGDTFNSGFGDFWTMKRNSQYLHPYGPSKRRPEMDSSGFHGDTFDSGFGDFWTMKRNMAGDHYPPGYGHDGVGKRRPEMDSSGFHGDTFSSGFGDFYTMKRNPNGNSQWKEKRRPEMDSSGFHGDTFNGGFGDFWTMKRTAQAHPLNGQEKRRPEMDSSGFHGDTFNGGFGDFWTMKRTALAHPLGYPDKRRPEMDSSGFHGDTFNSGFGDFWTMKRVPDSKSHGNPSLGKARSGTEGEDFDYEDRLLGAYGKRRPEMDSSGFHGDTFNGGFGDFWTMKRSSRERREADGTEKIEPSGFQGVGYDELLVDGSPPRWAYGKLESKRRPEMDSSGFHGDTFDSGFGDFWTMKRNRQIPYAAHLANSKRRPEMDSSGFHGDTFNSGFGDFWTMKRGGGYGVALPGHSPQHPDKRKPEMDSSGFHGDTFDGGFGDFWTMKRDNYADRLAEEDGAGNKKDTLPKEEVGGGVKDKGSEDDRGEGNGKSEVKSDNKKI